MNKQELEFIKIFNQAICPDDQKSSPQDMKLLNDSTHSEIVEQELQYYCCGLENSLCLLQEEINTLKEQNSRQEQANKTLLNELEALRWQVEYDKKLLKEIKNSRSWILARFMRAFLGLLTLNRSTIAELKSDLNDIVTSKSNASASSKDKLAILAYHMLHGVSKAAKKLGLASPVATMVTEKLIPDSQSVYCSFYQEDESFPAFPEDIKTVVFYLPQFHTFPENDQWWGKGFTEWTNTRKAQPRFPGHYQPRTPHQDIGYYCLAEIESLKKQADLARKHGIDFFCFYYYWFDGKKLMETPLELLISHPEIQMNFCLCWANENWTRAWDGQQKSILIQQNYSDENDINFIKDLKKYITDPRYMRCNGKPVILVYHAKVLPAPDKTFSAWRKWCRENGVGEICIWSCRTFIKNNEFTKSVEVDREVEFPPHMVTDLELFPASRFNAYKDDGYYYDYNKIIRDVQEQKTMADKSPYPFYRCAMLGWDNSSRRASGYSVWQYFSLQNYHRWLRANIEYTRREFLPQERFMFINAWNEWAEGTYLEPDEKYGYASINTTSRALCNLPAMADYQVLQPEKDPVASPGRVLIHIHVFYTDLWPEFAAYLNNMPFKYDCILTTDSRKKGAELKHQRHMLANCDKLDIKVVPNIGRDVAPLFTVVTKAVAAKYDFIGHFHTKKSVTVDWGDEWRHYLLDQLLGTPEYIKAVFKRFEREKELGIFFPTPYPAMRDYMNWENNRQRCKELLQQMNLKVNLPEHPIFPVGQMFWARTAAVKQLFSGIISSNNFEKEDFQVSNTLAHALERIWKYVAEGNNYSSLNGIFPPIQPQALTSGEKVRRLAIYVHYSANKKISDADLYMLKELKKSADIIFVNNGTLESNSTKQLNNLVLKIMNRKNRGYDFGAWRDALAKYNPNDYDELILLNNSVLGPFYSFDRIFAKMKSSDADFWGMTEFPKTDNPRREEAKALPGGIIPKHIQSYFMVFKRPVFQSECFRNFWQNVNDETSLPNVVAKYETRLSNLLEEAGFKSDVFLRTAKRLQEVDIITPEYNAIYCRPQDFLVLGFPFLKKNICYYMSQPEINETVHLISKLYMYPVANIKIHNKTR